MRGFSNFLIDHSKHPKELNRLLEHVTDYMFNIKSQKAKILLDMVIGVSLGIFGLYLGILWGRMKGLDNKKI